MSPARAVVVTNSAAESSAPASIARVFDRAVMMVLPLGLARRSPTARRMGPIAARARNAGASSQFHRATRRPGRKASAGLVHSPRDAERIAQRAVPVAPEHLLHRLHHLG